MTANGLRPLLIVISAPSGAGKSTLCECLLADRDDIVYSISCTTRQPRESEENGRDYFFLTHNKFKERVAAGDFLEHAEVYGSLYGTLKETVINALSKGKSVLMDIDIQGAGQIRDYVTSAPDGDLLKNAFLDIFIEPPSLDVLRSRLTDRNEDSEADIERRLRHAEDEMRHRGDYRYRIMNNDLGLACATLKRVIGSEQSAARESEL